MKSAASCYSAKVGECSDGRSSISGKLFDEFSPVDIGTVFWGGHSWWVRSRKAPAIATGAEPDSKESFVLERVRALPSTRRINLGQRWIRSAEEFQRILVSEKCLVLR